MPQRDVNPHLIVDVGVCEGHDSAFYMAKGFKVIGIEADPTAYATLRQKFDASLASGDFTLLNRAADEHSGGVVKFKPNTLHQGGSHIVRDEAASAADMIDVETIGWEELVGIAGVPYYCKIDIEGSEKYFLRGLLGRTDLPTYISAEIHTFEPVELLYAAGYRHFKMVNQRNMHLMRLPNPAREGIYLKNHRWIQASGPFGLETPGRTWFDFQEAAGLFNLILEARRKLLFRDWFDIHAYLPA